MTNSIHQSRIGFDKMGENYAAANNVTIDKEIIDNIDCYWFRDKEETETNRIVIFLHGGAFSLGSIHSHQAMVSHLAKALALPILFIDYSLAPEKPFPHALNDLLKIYRHLLNQYPGIEYILMGDSAGAGLSICLLSKLNEYGLQLPAFNVMVSPWIDLSCSNDSITGNAEIDPILTKERLLELAELYIGNQDLSNANPLEAPIHQYPPTLILVGSNEILLDDSKLLYSKIIDTQANTKLSIYEQQTHVWLLDDIHTEQSQKAVNEIETFVLCEVN